MNSNNIVNTVLILKTTQENSRFDITPKKLENFQTTLKNLSNVNDISLYVNGSVDINKHGKIQKMTINCKDCILSMEVFRTIRNAIWTLLEL